MIIATTAGLCRITTQEELAAAVAIERTAMERRHADIDAAGGDPDEVEAAHLAVDDADWQFVRDLDTLDTACSDLAARFAAFDIVAARAADEASEPAREAARALLSRPIPRVEAAHAWQAAGYAVARARGAMGAQSTPLTDPDPEVTQRLGDLLLEAAQAMYALERDQRRMVDATAARRKAEAILAQPTTDVILAEFAEEDRRLCTQVTTLHRRVPPKYALHTLGVAS